jgi:hypothetical protein
MPGGDDLDSLDVVPVVAIDSGPIDGVPDIQVYYSVDIPTAGTIGASGADVLGSFGGFTFLYAPAALLGLDGGGPNTDDIDALVVSDPPMGGYAPIAGGGGDYVLFSLAPGSGSLGLPDTCMGIPIEEGDVLADAFLFTGIGGLVPCILIPEEIINLWPARTCGLHPFHPGGDNIDGLDFVPAFPTPTSTTTSTSTTTTITTSTTTTSTSTTTSTTLAPLCGPAPEPDGSCKLADVSGLGKSSLQIKNDADNTKDSFKWKWNKGVATLIGDFDTPTVAGSTYRLCVYDASINPQPLLEADIPNGGLVPTCGTQPCWKPSGSTGFKYKNKAGTPEGVTGAKFKAGAAGKAQVQVRGKGGLLGPPATGSLAPSVVVQLLIDDGVTTECFKTTFSTFTLQSATQYKAKGP